MAQIHEGAGRPAIEYWLNKQQALFITAKSDGESDTASASNGMALITPRPTRPRRSWWALQAAWEGHSGGGQHPRDVHPMGTIHHLLRLLGRADQTAVAHHISIGMRGWRPRPLKCGGLTEPGGPIEITSPTTVVYLYVRLMHKGAPFSGG